MLRAAIGGGRWAPGDRLPTERELATELDVSRAIVREAMAVLRHEGLVVSRQGAGVFVTAESTGAAGVPAIQATQARRAAWVRAAGSGAMEDRAVEARASQQAVLDHVELRRAVEIEAAALAALRRTDDDLGRIRAARDALNRKIDDGIESVEEGFAFHRSIVVASGNRAMLHLLDEIRPMLFGTMRVMRENAEQREAFTAAVRQEHDTIVAAIAAGDADATRRAVLSHFVASEARVRASDPDVWTAVQRQEAVGPR